MPSLIDALKLARAGWDIVPLRGKIPVTSHGVKDASRDPEQIRAWWQGGAQHNIGARVPASYFVIDIDPQNGGTVEALEDATGLILPRTLTVHSGRGTGGRHLYFRHPGGVLTSRLLPPGIDVKTSTGYCVMPPSLHPETGMPYRWETCEPAPLPSPLLQLIRPPAPRPTEQPRHAPPLSRRALYLVEYVQDAPEGTRNARLFWAACQALRDGHPSETLELLEAAATVAGLSEPEARATIASARRTQGGAA